MPFDSQESGRDTGRQKTDDEYAEDVKAEFGDVAVKHFILDPSAASFKARLSRDGWPNKDANNDVLDGLRTQARMLKAGEYAIGPHESNDQCVRDYSAYLWDKRAQERGEDKPKKGEGDGSHTKDEERYDLLTLYPVEPEPDRRNYSVSFSSF